MVEIHTTGSEQEATAYYRDRLTELGWTFEGEFGFYSATKEGETLSLTILQDEAKDETLIEVAA